MLAPGHKRALATDTADGPFFDAEPSLPLDRQTPAPGTGLHE